MADVGDIAKSALGVAASFIPGLSAVSGLIGLFSGSHQKKEGLQEQADNVRPVLKESGLYNNLLGMFENMSQYGLDKNALTFANEKNQNALTASLQALLLSGGNPNQISDLYGQYTDSTNDLAIKDASLRWQKVGALADVTNKLFDAKREEFLYNQDGPYKDKAQLASAKIQAGGQEQMIGLDTLLGGLAKTLNTNYQLPRTNNNPTVAPQNNANTSNANLNTTAISSPVVAMLQQLTKMMTNPAIFNTPQ